MPNPARVATPTAALGHTDAINSGASRPGPRPRTLTWLNIGINLAKKLCLIRQHPDHLSLTRRATEDNSVAKLGYLAQPDRVRPYSARSSREKIELAC